MEPVETKEYKPGPIGKERSLKNRKAKDARGGEGEGLEGGVPGGGVSRATDSSPPTSDTTVPELGGDIEGMITVPSAEYNSNSKVFLITLFYDSWIELSNHCTSRLLVH